MRKDRHRECQCRRRQQRYHPHVGPTIANVTPHIDGGRAKEVERRPEDAPGLVALTPGSPRGSGFSSFRDATLDDVMSIPKSSNIADLGTGERGLSGYP
jgi:hypothetical protein